MPEKQGAKQDGEGGSVAKGRRQVLVGPWHFCDRCGSRVPLADLQWQNGLLLCNESWFNCFDTEVVGERDALMSQVTEIPTEELLPDPKLTDPDIMDDLGDFIA